MIRSTTRTVTIALTALILTVGLAMAQTHTSQPFSGPKVNGGTVTHSAENGRHTLTLSPDFQVPDTPDPHWQVTDSRGNVHLLQRLGVKSSDDGGKDRITLSITLPAYVSDVASVQIYCAWAETILGDAPFSSPQRTTSSSTEVPSAPRSASRQQ